VPHGHACDPTLDSPRPSSPRVRGLPEHHFPTSRSTRTAILILGNQSPDAEKKRVRTDDACPSGRCQPQVSRPQGKSAQAGVRQSRRLTTELLAEGSVPISQIVDQIVLVAIHPPCQGDDKDLQSMGYRQWLRPSGTARIGPCLDDSAASVAFLNPTGTASLVIY